MRSARHAFMYYLDAFKPFDRVNHWTTRALLRLERTMNLLCHEDMNVCSQ